MDSRGRRHHAAHRRLPGRRQGPQDHLPRHAGSRGVHADARPRRQGHRHRGARRRRRRRRQAADARGDRPRARPPACRSSSRSTRSTSRTPTPTGSSSSSPTANWSSRSTAADVVSCEVSAKKRTGLDDLLEMILLVADMKELKADPDKPATGVVLEARLDRARGRAGHRAGPGGHAQGRRPVHRRLGLRQGPRDDRRARRSVSTEAGPVDSGRGDGIRRRARGGRLVPGGRRRGQGASDRRVPPGEDPRASSRRSRRAATLREPGATTIAAGEVKELPILLKADVQGSLEALAEGAGRTAVGQDPRQRAAILDRRDHAGRRPAGRRRPNAIIVGFNVRPDRAAAGAGQGREGRDPACTP